MDPALVAPDTVAPGVPIRISPSTINKALPNLAFVSAFPVKLS